MFNTLKKINPFKKKINYKELYNNEISRRQELEKIHKSMCSQIISTLDDSKHKYQLYKFKDKDV